MCRSDGPFALAPLRKRTIFVHFSHTQQQRVVKSSCYIRRKRSTISASRRDVRTRLSRSAMHRCHRLSRRRRSCATARRHRCLAASTLQAREGHTSCQWFSDRFCCWTGGLRTALRLSSCAVPRATSDAQRRFKSATQVRSGHESAEGVLRCCTGLVWRHAALCNAVKPARTRLRCDASWQLL